MCAQVIKISCANCGYVQEMPRPSRVKTRTCGLCDKKFKLSPDGSTQTIPIVKIQACFIATAAYGTPFAKEIDVLRDFRDDTLMTNVLGRAFIRFYYILSPPIAKFIGRSELLRKIVRGLLNPLIRILG
ncbi:MAG: CFI-box-CTERM domain-containing protein [Halobacteriota archaeon]|nr:CFI-box-CTERM domain-containing protein [Halobacteriota archaeon]